MPTIYRAVQSIADKYFWLCLAALLMFSVFYNGLGVVPSQHYYRLSRNPYITRTNIASDNYWQESVLLPVFANVAGLTSRLSFHLFCVAIILASYLVFAYFASQKLGRFTTLVLTALLVGHSTNAVLYSWVGTPDGVTFLLGVLALFVTSRPVLFVIAVLAALNHPIASLAILGILALRILSAEDKIDWKTWATCFVGAVIGLALVRLFIAYHQITLFSRLDFILARDLKFWMNLNFGQPWLTLYSFNGMYWIVIAVCFVLFFARDRRYFLGFVLLNLVYYLVTFFTVDTTRVFSLLAWGAAFQCVIHSLHLDRRYYSSQPRLEPLLVVVALAGLVLPKYVMWGGSADAPPFDTFYRQVWAPAMKRLR